MADDLMAQLEAELEGGRAAVDKDDLMAQLEREVGAPDVSRVESLARGGIQGLSLGYGEEIAAGTLASEEVFEETDALVRDALRRREGEGFRDYLRRLVSPSEAPERTRFTPRYEALRDEARRKDAEAAEANPWAFGAGQVAGALVPAVLTGGQASVGGRILAGAAHGGVSGVGMSEAKDVEGLAKDAAIGTALGGAFSAGGEAIGAGIRKGAEVFGRGAQVAAEGFEEHAKRAAARQAAEEGLQQQRIASGEALKLRRASRLNPAIRAAKEEIEKAKAVVDDLIASGADDEAIKAARQTVRQKHAEHRKLMRQRAKEKGPSGESMSSLGRQKAEARFERAIARGDEAALDAADSGNIVARALGTGQEAVGSMGAAIAAPLLGSMGGPLGVAAGFLARDVAKRALSSPRLAQATADALMAAAQRSQSVALYLPVLTSGLQAGSRAGAQEMIQRHLILMDTDPHYRAEIERLELEDAE